MKKTLILLALPFTSLAQKSYFIRPVISYANTMLYNKEDTKKASNALLGTNPLPMQATYSPSFGVQAGMAFGKTTAGLQAIAMGIGYTPFQQKYSGYCINNSVNYKDQLMNASVKLNYINIPFLAEFALTKAHKITPIANVGVNIGYLSSYTLNCLVSPYYTNTSTSLSANIHNSTFTSTVGSPYNSENGSIDKWYYKKLIISSQVGIGAKMVVNDKISIQALLFNMYSFGDVENKKDITYTFTNAALPNVLQTNTQNPYVQNYAIVSDRDHYAHGTTRPASHLIQTGIQLACTYTLHK